MSRLRLLHYLVTKSHGEFVAHCLDVDVVATGPTVEEAVRALNVLVKSSLEYAVGCSDYSCVTPAPEAYWERFGTARVEPRGILELKSGLGFLPSAGVAHLNVMANEVAAEQLVH